MGDWKRESVVKEVVERFKEKHRRRSDEQPINYRIDMETQEVAYAQRGKSSRRLWPPSRVHSTQWREPAMEARLAKHAWSVEELVSKMDGGVELV